MTEAICGHPIKILADVDGSVRQVTVGCTKRVGHAIKAHVVGADKVHSFRAEFREGDPRQGTLY